MNSGYDLDATVPAVVALQRHFTARSDEAAELPGARLDLAYGDEPRQRLDIFPAGPMDPVLVFIHGGYWKTGSKDGRRFPALEWAGRGVSWVCLNYRLLPQATLADAVDDVRSALLWLVKHGAAHSIDPGQLHVTGNSAGAHLAAMGAAADWEARPLIASLTLISGLFDLAPLREKTAQDWLALSAAQARTLSPIHHLPPPDIPILIGWGGDETPEFDTQSRAFAKACQANGNPVDLFDSPGKNHFEIIGDYGHPGTPLFSRLEALLA